MAVAAWTDPRKQLKRKLYNSCHAGRPYYAPGAGGTEREEMASEGLSKCFGPAGGGVVAVLLTAPSLSLVGPSSQHAGRLFPVTCSEFLIRRPFFTLS